MLADGCPGTRDLVQVSLDVQGLQGTQLAEVWLGADVGRPSDATPSSRLKWPLLTRDFAAAAPDRYITIGRGPRREIRHMLPRMALRYVVLDFDGTCTQIDLVHAAFLASYRENLENANGHARGGLAQAWDAAIAEVRAASPNAGWTLFGAPSTAPAAADPYILASEASALLERQRTIRQVPADAYSRAYAAHPAPWRPDVAEVLAALVERGLQVGFISNSERFAIQTRLTDLLHADRALRGRIVVHGDAAKYKLAELPVGATGPAAAHRAEFEKLDGAVRAHGTTRPIYLRRGSYFEALCGLWQDLGASGYPIAETIVCGDIWELDLALPRALGAHVHLIRRAAPFETYPYELAQLGSPEDASWDLLGVVEHVDRLQRTGGR